MKPKSQPANVQNDLFRIRFADLLEQRHELYPLADLIAWEKLDQVFGTFFAPSTGAPALPTRLIAGLHYLKHAFALSDEAVVERWVENPYWQYFCGEEYFRHTLPCHPTSLTKWRKRIGEAGCEWMLSVTIQAGVDSGTVKRRHFQSVTVDTTVQEKAVTYPTDGTLYARCRQHLVRLAKRHHLPLRQNYTRIAPRLLTQSHRYHHARQMKRKRRRLKHLKTLVGRVYRDIDRHLPRQPQGTQAAFVDIMQTTRHILKQEPQDKNKRYCVHAPEVECIGNGKAHKKYAFGVKGDITVTNKSNFVLGARSFPGTP